MDECFRIGDWVEIIANYDSKGKIGRIMDKDLDGGIVYYTIFFPGEEKTQENFIYFSAEFILYNNKISFHKS